MAEQSRIMAGLFPDRGYGKNNVDLVIADETRERHFAKGNSGSAGASGETELGSKAAEGAGIGAGIGGMLGAFAAAVAAVGTSIALPGIGLVIAGPWLQRWPAQAPAVPQGVCWAR